MRSITTLLGIATALFVWSQLTPQSPTLTALPCLSENDAACAATTVNDSGQVGGWSGNPKFPIRPVLWKGKKATELEVPQGATGAWPGALSQDGRFLAGICTDNETDKAMLWQGGKATLLEKLPGSEFSHALGVNSQGVAVGYEESGERLGAVLWRAGKIQRLEGGIVATAINDSGLVLGVGGKGALVWKEGKGVLLRGTRVDARALSPGGVIAGHQGGKPTIWQSYSAAPALLPCPKDYQGDVLSVNDRGQALGYLYNKERDIKYVYWKSGKLFSADSLIPRGSDFVNIIPRSINNKGEIVGTGTTRQGKQCGFVYTP